jgi:hypothetical protein
METLIYYIKFDRHEPEKIIVGSLLELWKIVEHRVLYYGQLFEWLIRAY